MESLIVPSESLNLTTVSFGITLAILLSSWYPGASRRDHGNPL